MKINVVSGFLGAGKTTLIKKLLEENVFQQEKVVVLENEYGEVGIDGELLAGEAVQVKEIYSGCICCTLVGDFVDALEELSANFQPDRIIIEPSGVARLSETRKALEQASEKCQLQVDTLMAVVDVLNFESYAINFGDFYLDQVVHGEGIFLSRASQCAPEIVNKVVSSIKMLNPEAEVVSCSWKELPGKSVLETARNGALQKRKASLLEKAFTSYIKSENHTPAATDIFDFWGMETDKKYSKEKLKKILKLLREEGQYGRVFRAKGLVFLEDGSRVRFDYVPGEDNINELSPGDAGKLLVIGRNLNKRKLEKLFEKA